MSVADSKINKRPENFKIQNKTIQNSLSIKCHSYAVRRTGSDDFKNMMSRVALLFFCKK